MYKWIGLYLLVWNLIGFCQMGVDKKRAKTHRWRISERRLFLVALLGGSLGCILGMRLFHHKTRHWYFVWGMPLILAVQTILLFGGCYLLFYK